MERRRIHRWGRVERVQEVLPTAIVTTERQRYVVDEEALVEVTRRVGPVVTEDGMLVPGITIEIAVYPQPRPARRRGEDLEEEG